VNAAIKLIPLGQTAGQRMVSSLINEIPEVVHNAMQLDDNEIGSTSIGLGMASANHETQYSRLFRS
jgi:urease accessory protein